MVASPYVVSVNFASAGTLLAMVKPLSFITLPVVPLNTATRPDTADDGPVTAPSSLLLSSLLIRPFAEVVASPYVVSVNFASAGTLLAMVKPLSFITLPVVPLNTATRPDTAEVGPVTAPSTLACTTVQWVSLAVEPAVTHITMSPTSHFCPAYVPAVITL